MKEFAALVMELASGSGTLEKIAALNDYFETADDADKVWVIALFSGRRPRRFVSATQLQIWCADYAMIPKWLFDECYHTVGDLAETIALLMPENQHDEHSDISLAMHLQQCNHLLSAPEEDKKAFVLEQWKTLSKNECFVFNKLITGGFRIGVSQKMMVNALAKHVKLSPSEIAHRIIGKWDPVTTSFKALLSEDQLREDPSRPYPFYLSHALEDRPDILGDISEWQAEWKWDGMRGQIIKRNDTLFVWSRGEELITEKFPEYQALSELLPNGTVLDGEIICLHTDEENIQPLPFALLQTRIGRKQVSKKQLKEAPAAFIAYDILEWEGKDTRTASLLERRNLLETLFESIHHPALRLSPVIPFQNWEELSAIRSKSREHGSEGLMLKRMASPYQTGRKKGDWWKWKIDPLVIDCVMIYAQKGHGRRSNLYTDYTFAVRDGEKLVTFTKAYSGLTDKEFAEVDAFVKKNAIEKFGPVRTVTPALVFEVAFEGIAASSRHKSGVALRFPRIHRWRKDKTVADINTLDDLKAMLNLYGK